MSSLDNNWFTEVFQDQGTAFSLQVKRKLHEAETARDRFGEEIKVQKGQMESLEKQVREAKSVGERLQGDVTRLEAENEALRKAAAVVGRRKRAGSGAGAGAGAGGGGGRSRG